jgi:hypothetical protein
MAYSGRYATKAQAEHYAAQLRSNQYRTTIKKLKSDWAKSAPWAVYQYKNYDQYKRKR